MSETPIYDALMYEMEIDPEAEAKAHDFRMEMILSGKGHLLD